MPGALHGRRTQLVVDFDNFGSFSFPKEKYESETDGAFFRPFQIFFIPNYMVPDFIGRLLPNLDKLMGGC
jgi:hypothetical protein